LKVAHLTSVHAPLDTRIFYKECGTLAEAGYEVVLIAPHERDEIFDKVRTRAVPKPKNRADRMTRTAWQILSMALEEEAEIYHFHDPELIPVGLLLRLLGKRVVYDAHEDVPKQILSKHWISPQLRAGLAQAVNIIERLCALSFDGIVAATPAIAKRFPSKKTVFVQNFPIVSSQVSHQFSSYVTRSPIIAYVDGGMTAIRGIKEMVEAMRLVPASLGAKLVLAGSFDPELESEIRNMQTFDGVEFLGWQSPEKVRDLLGEARAGLVLYHPVPNHVEAQPTKLFEYMCAGIPVVASDFPLWRDIVEGTGCGLLVDPLDPKAIAGAIQWLLEHPKESEAMGMRGLHAVQSQFNWHSEGDKLLNLYRTISPTRQTNLEVS
jgi:glycosyltransferase involved in cell wall biosynthesis